MLRSGAVEGFLCTLAQGNSNAKQASSGAMEKLAGSREALEATVSSLVRALMPSRGPCELRARAARSIACLTRGSPVALAAVALAGAIPALISSLVSATGSDAEGPRDPGSLALREAACR